MGDTLDSYCAVWWWAEQAIPQAIQEHRVRQELDKVRTYLKSLESRPVRDHAAERINWRVVISEFNWHSQHTTSDNVRFITRNPLVHFVQQQCVKGMLRYGEICPNWLEPYPHVPVNSLEAAAQYLREVSARWFLTDRGHRTRETECGETFLNEAQRDLSNSWRTIEWISWSLSDCLPLPSPLPKATTADDAFRQKAELMLWLTHAMRTSGKTERRGRKHFSALEDESKFEIWLAWQRDKCESDSTKDSFLARWNLEHRASRITLKELNACGALVRKRVKEGNIPAKFKDHKYLRTN